MAVYSANIVIEQGFDYNNIFVLGDAANIPTSKAGSVAHFADDAEVEETRRISGLSVNEPITDRLFTPDLFFKDVEFVGDFNEAYGLH